MIYKLLEAIKSKRKVLIQTHDIPDPDTMAAAFALKNLLVSTLKKRVTIAYKGMIGRAENKELVKRCKIDMHDITKLNPARYDYFVFVDTQPGAGNIYEIEQKKPDAVIDHHALLPISTTLHFYDIRPNYGSTSTIIAEYYKQLGIIPDINTATALYYGIKTDIFGKGRPNSQADMDMISFVFPHASFSKLNNIETPELPRYYFKTIRKAIDQSVIYDDLIFCNLEEVKNSDFIAEIADYLLRMRDIKSSFVVGKVNQMCHFSIRNKTNKKSAGAIASSIAKGIGSGGGHTTKSAGGQIPLQSKNYEEIIEILKFRLLKKIGIKNTEEKQI